MLKTRTWMFGLPLVVVALIANVGCGKEDSESSSDTGTVKVELSKSTSARYRADAKQFNLGKVFGLNGPAMAVSDIPTGGTAITPTLFQMKLANIYLVEDVDSATQDNKGAISGIWYHPNCADLGSCTDEKADYFDLTDPTEANKVLAANAQPATPGTYKYIRIGFCVGSAVGNNVKYKTAGMTAEKETQYGGCGETSAEMNPPLTVAAGGSVTVKLGYNFADGPIYSMTSGSCTTSEPCLSGITLSPTVSQ